MRIRRSQWFMELAELVAQRSTCDRLHVGAVAVKGDRMLCSGYNGAPAGIPHCVHGLEVATPCTRAVHAEVNAIATAAKYGIALEQATMVVTHMPCLSCSGLLINAGISRVVYRHAYRDSAGIRLMDQAGIEVIEWE